MAKPILTIGVSNKLSYETMESFRNTLEKKLRGYYIIMYFMSTEDPIFNVFYEKDYEEKKIEEIREFIKKSMLKINKDVDPEIH